MKLMGQFVIASMTDTTASIPFDLEFDDDFNIAAMQEQAPLWCVRSKGFLLSNVAEDNSLQCRFVTYTKQFMTCDFRSNRAMSYLYNNSEMDILTQQVSMLAMHSQFKNVENILDIDSDIQKTSLNSESVSVAIGIYTYFTILSNPNMNDNQFDELFIRSWYNYYANWSARLIMFRMNGNTWKNSFIGVLLD